MPLHKRKNIAQKILLVVLIFAALYGSIYLYAVNSDAFATFNKWCSNAEALHKIIGKCNKAHISPFNTFYLKYKGDVSYGGFNAHIIGSMKTVDVQVKMKKENGAWGVVSVAVEGELIKPLRDIGSAQE